MLHASTFFSLVLPLSRSRFQKESESEAISVPISFKFAKKIMAGETIQIYNNGNMMHDFDFKPSTSIDEELGKFVTWFKEYYRYE